MKALVFDADRVARVHDVPDPIPGPRDVLIAVEASGVCHTDLDILAGRYPAGLPRIPGHEFCGRVVALGAAVDAGSGITVGDRGAVDPLITCGTCRNCDRGHRNLCPTLRAYGADLDGGAAEYAAVDVDNVCPVGDLDPRLAALAEPLGCALHVLSRIEPPSDARVLVFGAGPMGVILGVALRSRGLTDLTIVDLHESRLQVARSFGFSATHMGGPDLAERIGLRSYDLVVDATGQPTVGQDAVPLVADAGTLLVFGVCPPGSTLTVDPHEIYSRELTVTGSFSLQGTHRAAVSAMQASTEDLTRLVTKVVPFDDAAPALDAVGGIDSIKIQIHPGSGRRRLPRSSHPSPIHRHQEKTMDSHTQIYVDGGWVESASTKRIDVINPATEEVIASVPAGHPSDVDAAVVGARKALSAWSATSTQERADWMQKLTDGLAERKDEIAHSVSSEVGMPCSQATEWQAALPIRNFQFYADHIRNYSYDAGQVKHSPVVKEPVGVVGCITPWNYPLHQIAFKVAPAIAAGCTVVLKPSEVAPLTAYILAEVADAVGLPAGVLNVVSGDGAVVGEALASHPDVDMVSFTGSARAGTRVSELAAPSVKLVALELGGKSANVILDDADLEVAVADGVANCYFNAGKTCTALTRMFVPRDQLDHVEAIATKAASAFRTGDPFDGATNLGPIVSEHQHGHVLDLIASGIGEGAKLLTDGADRPEEKGYFVAPTVFSRVTPEMRVSREEIFGPVLAILPYDTESEAVAMANETEYGLSGGVWSGDQDRATAVARQLRTGQVSVNGGGFNNEAPFGGYKRCGLGREAGSAGFEEYLETKAIHLG